jgi:ribose 5-phosphate isomerase A
VPFAVSVVQRELERMGASVSLRMDASGDYPFRSDNGNQIVDVRFREIKDAGALEQAIDALPGVVDSGLFIGMADRVLVQSSDSSDVRSLGRS